MNGLNNLKRNKIMKKQETPTAKKIASKMMGEREKTNPMDSEEFMDALKKVQKEAGTPESQKILDKLIAMQRLKQDLKPLTEAEKREIHTLMEDRINCEEYIVITLNSAKGGLQTQLLTQLDSQNLLGILLEITKEIQQQVKDGSDELTVSE
jgi:hypothetical protein